VIIDGRAGAPGEGSAAKEDNRPHRLDLFEAVLSGFIAAFAVS